MFMSQKETRVQSKKGISGKKNGSNRNEGRERGKGGEKRLKSSICIHAIAEVYVERSPKRKHREAVTILSSRADVDFLE